MRLNIRLLSQLGGFTRWFAVQWHEHAQCNISERVLYRTLHGFWRVVLVRMLFHISITTAIRGPLKHRATFVNMKSVCPQLMTISYPFRWPRDPLLYHDWFKFTKHRIGSQGSLLQKGGVTTISSQSWRITITFGNLIGRAIQELSREPSLISPYVCVNSKAFYTLQWLYTLSERSHDAETLIFSSYWGDHT